MEIILSNLVRRPVRTAVSVLAVGMEVLLILAIVGLVNGIKAENAMRVQGLGADIMLQPPGASLFLGMGANVMDEAMAEAVQTRFEGVEAVTPVLTQFNSQEGLDLVFGIDPESFDQVTGGFTFLEGRLFEEPGEIVVDDLYAGEEIEVGDRIRLLNLEFRVSGIVAHGKGSRIYMDIREAQEITGDIGQVSILFITTTSEEATDTVIAGLEEALPDYEVKRMSEYLSLMLASSHVALDAFLAAVMGVAVTIGLLVIFLSMYTTISERTREIGILRSMGASRAWVVRLILQEAGVLALAGIATGILGSYAVSWTVSVISPTITILIDTRWILNATFFAVFSSLVGALYPSFRAAGQDPVEALAYE
jgi:putative ABC transport system permease protein